MTIVNRQLVLCLLVLGCSQPEGIEEITENLDEQLEEGNPQNPENSAQPPGKKALEQRGTKQEPLPAQRQDCAHVQGFSENIQEFIVSTCLGCHGAGGMASERLELNDQAKHNAHKMSQYTQIVSENPFIIRKLSGLERHGGGILLRPEDIIFQQVKDWGQSVQSCLADNNTPPPVAQPTERESVEKPTSETSDEKAGAGNPSGGDATPKDTIPDEVMSNKGSQKNGQQSGEDAISAELCHKKDFYKDNLHAFIEDNCLACHDTGGIAEGFLNLTSSAGLNPQQLRPYLNLSQPQHSFLLEKLNGKVKHTGGKLIEAGGEVESAFIGWGKQIKACIVAQNVEVKPHKLEQISLTADRALYKVGDEVKLLAKLVYRDYKKEIAPQKIKVKKGAGLEKTDIPGVYLATLPGEYQISFQFEETEAHVKIGVMPNELESVLIGKGWDDGCPTFQEFHHDINPILQQNCTSCHSAFASSVFHIPKGDQCENASNVYHNTLSKLDGDPAQDTLIAQKVIGGLGHTGGMVLAKDSPEYGKLVSWIEMEKKCRTHFLQSSHGLCQPKVIDFQLSYVAERVKPGSEISLNALALLSNGTQKLLDAVDVAWSVQGEHSAQEVKPGTFLLNTPGLYTIVGKYKNILSKRNIVIGNPIAREDVVNVTTDPNRIKLIPGESFQLSFFSIDKDKNKHRGFPNTIEVSEEGVVAVDKDGSLYAQRVGEATVTFSLYGMSASVAVTVEYPKVSRLQFDQEALKVAMGEEAKARLSAFDATESSFPLENLKLSFISSNESIFEADSKGTITPVAPGKATLTVKDAYSSLQDSIAVTILPAYFKSIQVFLSQKSIAEGEKVQAIATGYLSNGETHPLSQNFRWSVSHTSLAAVDEKSGWITAKKAGFVQIIASDGNVRGKADLLIQPPTGCSSSFVYKTKVDPILQTQCLSCHYSEGMAAGFLPLNGPKPSSSQVSQNWEKMKSYLKITDSKVKNKIIRKILLQESHGPNGTPLLDEASQEFQDITQWIEEEIECKKNNINTNLVRLDPLSYIAKAQNVFPSAYTNQGWGGNPIHKFYEDSARGVWKVFANESRAFSPEIQAVLRQELLGLCSHYVLDNREHRLFNEDVLLANERIQGMDESTFKALLAARNALNYPYPQDHYLVERLGQFRRDVVAQGQSAGLSNPDAQGDFGICVATFSSPAFWLGNIEHLEGADALNRASLALTKQLPSYQDVVDFIQSKDRKLWMKDFVERIPDDTKKHKRYIENLKEWHRKWLGLRENYFRPGLNFTPRYNLGGAKSPAGLVGGKFGPLGRSPDGLWAYRFGKYKERTNFAEGPSESCDINKLQEFDPNTTKVEHLVYNDHIHAYEVVGGWVVNLDGTWTEFSGKVTLENGEKKDVNLSDISRLRRYRTDGYDPSYLHYHKDSALHRTPADFIKRDYRKGEFYKLDKDGNRIRFRITRRYGSDGALQDGVSEVQWWYSGEKARVCNTQSRFFATCYFRPKRGELPKRIRRYNWKASDEGVAYFRGTGTFHPHNIVYDSFLHPVSLQHFRCGVPLQGELALSGSDSYREELAFPKGEVGQTNPVMVSAVFSTSGAFRKDPPREERYLDSLKESLKNESNHLIEHILTENMPYTDLLLANYTFGSKPFELLLKTHGQFVVGYPYDYSVSTEEEDLKMRMIRESDIQPMAKHHFIPSWETHRSTNKEVNYQLSGILTHTSFFQPMLASSDSPRSISARIFSRLLCGLPSDFSSLLSEDDVAKHSTFVATEENGADAHLDPSKGCMQCHINLDPVASVFTNKFMKHPNKGTYFELSPSASFYTGIQRQDVTNEGAFLGQDVQGLKDLARKVAHSPQFANCTVKTAFKNIFGRSPVGAEITYIHELSERFRGELGYNYNAMIQELIISHSFMRGY